MQTCYLTPFSVASWVGLSVTTADTHSYEEQYRHCVHLQSTHRGSRVTMQSGEMNLLAGASTVCVQEAGERPVICYFTWELLIAIYPTADTRTFHFISVRAHRHCKEPWMCWRKSCNPPKKFYFNLYCFTDNTARYSWVCLRETSEKQTPTLTTQLHYISCFTQLQVSSRCLTCPLFKPK